MIIDQQRRCVTSVLQLCDYVDPAVHLELRRQLPASPGASDSRHRGPSRWNSPREVALRVDALLLDSANTTLAVKQLGGTGRTHDWITSRQIREAVDIPLFLAGGLSAANVAEAVRRVNPFGLDVCSGVRTEGKLDAEKLAALFAALDF